MILFYIVIGVVVLYLGLLIACIIKCVKRSDKQFKIVDTIFEEDKHNG